MEQNELDVDGYKNLVEKYGASKHYLNSYVMRRYNAVRKIFALTFGFQSNVADFKKFADIKYFTDDSPSKMSKFAGLVGLTFACAEQLDEVDELNRALEHYGVKLEKIVPRPALMEAQLDPKKQKALNRSWKVLLGPNSIWPSDKNEVFNLLLSQSQDLQKSICEFSDNMKSSGVPDAKDNYAIEGSNFKIAVGIEAGRIKKSRTKHEENLKTVKAKRVTNFERAMRAFDE